MFYHAAWTAFRVSHFFLAAAVLSEITMTRALVGVFTRIFMTV
jgi:hypothetical protein